MKAAQSRYETTLFGGARRPYALAAATPSVSARHEPARTTAPAPARTERPGLLGRIGEWLWRRQLRSVDVYVAKSDDIFANLDRWLWKQHMRETEAWLAQSKDVYDLEARIRHLERSRDGRVF